MKPSLNIATPSRHVADPSTIEKFARESAIPETRQDGRVLTGATSVPGIELPLSEASVAAIAEEDAKREATVIFKLTKKDRDLLDVVFAKSSYKSRRALFEAEFMPRLKEMAAGYGIKV